MSSISWVWVKKELLSSMMQNFIAFLPIVVGVIEGLNECNRNSKRLFLLFARQPAVQGDHRRLIFTDNRVLLVFGYCTPAHPEEPLLSCFRHS